MEQIANSNAVARSEYDAVKVLPKEPKGLASGTPAKIKAKTISLFWNNALHTIVPNVDGRYNLNQLHNASGYSATKRPPEWARNSQTVDFINKYSSAGNPAVIRINGGSKRGTWAIEEMVYAYASWLSAEFHKAVLDAFTAAIHGDMVKVKEIVRTAVRQEGVPVHAQENITSDYCRKLLKHSLSEVAYRREKRER
ncbi:KilA-N domain-containing protein [Salmonella enterica subsp. enterica serovar Telelkebir]|nr:KilA-N domain-containing protein [Salmonella enterica subsp. enterica serovar Telelkebir]